MPASISLLITLHSQLCCSSHWSNTKQNRLHYGKSSQVENFVFTNEMYINIKCICMCVCVCAHVCVCAKLLQLCPTLWPYGLYPTRLLCPWDSPGKKTGVVARIFSRASSRPRCRTHRFSCVGRWFGFFVCLFVFATRATWEACFGCISWESAIYPGNVILFSIWELISIIYHSNNLKKKNHLILSEGIENNFWPNSTSIPDKPTQKN